VMCNRTSLFPGNGFRWDGWYRWYYAGFWCEQVVPPGGTSGTGVRVVEQFAQRLHREGLRRVQQPRIATQGGADRSGRQSWWSHRFHVRSLQSSAAPPAVAPVPPAPQ
jgi:hypothetical protein